PFVIALVVSAWPPPSRGKYPSPAAGCCCCNDKPLLLIDDDVDAAAAAALVRIASVWRWASALALMRPPAASREDSAAAAAPRARAAATTADGPLDSTSTAAGGDSCDHSVAVAGTTGPLSCGAWPAGLSASAPMLLPLNTLNRPPAALLSTPPFPASGVAAAAAAFSVLAFGCDSGTGGAGSATAPLPLRTLNRLLAALVSAPPSPPAAAAPPLGEDSSTAGEGRSGAAANNAAGAVSSSTRVSGLPVTVPTCRDSLSRCTSSAFLRLPGFPPLSRYSSFSSASFSLARSRSSAGAGAVAPNAFLASPTEAVAAASILPAAFSMYRLPPPDAALP
ncbi:unnamed protein product, partial [Ectocarpus sp. 12 AP-2014]